MNRGTQVWGTVPPRRRRRRRFGWRTKLLVAIFVPLLLLLFAEAALRICGLPTYRYASLLITARGTYPPSTTTVMEWGPVPYLLSTNALGLRGPEVSAQPAPGTLRIFTVGDSITDCFFVDDDATWQPRLQKLLAARMGRPVEVINGATGGGSIDHELAIVRQIGLPLHPDWVLLTFCTNDIFEIMDKTVVQMSQRPTNQRSIAQRCLAVLAHTAIGEVLLNLYIPDRAPRDQRTLDDARYVIAGGEAFAANAADFSERHKDVDGLLMTDPLSPDVEPTLVKYEMILRQLVDECRSEGVRVGFVYFPSYPQIYDENPARRINHHLGAMSGRLQIPFFDLTDGFRSAGKNRVLHLAPVDYHLNPAGNAVFADALADLLVPALGGPNSLAGSNVSPDETR